MTAVHVPMPVQGALDTNGPVSNRVPGTLVEATDLDTLAWAARRCLTQKSWVYRCPSGTFPNPKVPTFDGTSGYGSVVMRPIQQVNLGTRWTLDLVFNPEAVSHSADATVPLFQWWLSGIEAIGVYLRAGGAPGSAQRKLVAVVTPTSAPGVAGTPVTLSGTTQLTVGALQGTVHHARLVRDRGSLALLADAVTEATSSSLSAAQRHEVGSGTVGTCYLGTASGVGLAGNHLFKGRLLRALLRSGAATDPTRGMRDVSFHGGPGCHLLVHGKMLTTFGQREGSPYQSELSWTGMTHEDVTEPAPWFSSGIQGGCYFVDSLGRGWNVVAAGGTIFAKRAG